MNPAADATSHTIISGSISNAPRGEFDAQKITCFDGGGRLDHAPRGDRPTGPTHSASVRAMVSAEQLRAAAGK